MFKPGAIRLCILALFVVAVACNSEQPLPVVVDEPDPARVRIVHAAPGIGGVEVLRNGVATPIVPYLNYGAFTQSCIQLPPDESHTLTFRQGVTEIASVTLTPAENAKYSVFLTAAGTARRVVVLNDAHTAVAGSNAVRFINASSGPGDVYVTAPNGEITAGVRVYRNIGVTAMGNVDPDFLATDTTRTQVRLYDVDVMTGAPRVDLRLFGLPASRLATVVLADPAVAGPSASFLTYPC